MPSLISKSKPNTSYQTPDHTAGRSSFTSIGDPISGQQDSNTLQMRPFESAETHQMNPALSDLATVMSPNSIQMSPAIAPISTLPQPTVQKDGEEDTEESEESSGESNPLARLVEALLRDQLSDSSMRGHLSSLGTALRDMAAESTVESSGGPEGAVARLTALHIPQAFQSASNAIIQDPELRHFRRRIAEIIGTNDLTALITAVAAGLAAFLADIDLEAEPSTNLGENFTIGGMFNLGSAQDISFHEVQAYVQYANDHFSTRITGGLEQEQADEETGEEEHLIGTGTGEVRVGSDRNHLLSRVTLNSDGEITLLGRLSAGAPLSGSDRLILRADVSHMFSSGETLFRPGISGQFNLRSGGRLEIGSQLQISSEESLNQLTGFIEYQEDHLFLRLEGDLGGIGGERSIVPGQEMRVQVRLSVTF